MDARGRLEEHEGSVRVDRNLILIECEIFYVVQKIEAVFTESPAISNNVEPFHALR